MNKHKLHQLILDALEAVYDAASNAARQAHETATHKETIAENKYDTFGLEASYLAEGQLKRALQAEEDIRRFRNLVVKNFSENDEIGYGAYVELSDQQGQVLHLFVSPVAGGIAIDYDGRRIGLVTAEAPLGKKLLGAGLDDAILFNAKSLNEKLYQVTRLA